MFEVKVVNNNGQRIPLRGKKVDNLFSSKDNAVDFQQKQTGQRPRRQHTTASKALSSFNPKANPARFEFHHNWPSILVNYKMN
ncbi:hypothetical protein BLOT_015904 [Blomia tropicalis]|nr:hypothetical protein BLOT_015904 [Blomia tropicalis]